jgi:hypothetical protein
MSVVICFAAFEWEKNAASNFRKTKFEKARPWKAFYNLVRMLKYGKFKSSK